MCRVVHKVPRARHARLVADKSLASSSDTPDFLVETDADCNIGVYPVIPNYAEDVHASCKAVQLLGLESCTRSGILSSFIAFYIP